MSRGAGGIPGSEMKGKGTVSPSETPGRASYDFHYQEFLSRGLSKEESDRLAKAVVARDAAVEVAPLKLSAAEAAKRKE